MIKKVEIYFADPSILIGDHLEDVTEAINWASANLRLRHSIIVRKIDCEVGHRFVTITLELPNSMLELSAGRHLRGISKWLLKNRPDIYENHRVGNRLLYVRPLAQEEQLP